MACFSKLLLLSVSFWCILEILQGVLLRRSLDTLNIVISLGNCPCLEEVIEPMVRWEKLSWQVAGIEPQIAVRLCGSCEESTAIVRKLIHDRVVVPHLTGTPDLVLNPSRNPGNASD